MPALVVVTEAALANRTRRFDEPSLTTPTGQSLLCDMHAAEDRGEPATAQVKAGLSQSTCPTCHTAFLYKGRLPDGT